MRAKLKYALNSDVSLLRNYAKGDMAAFEELYRRHKDGLYNFLYRSVSSQAIAEEIAQEVWLAVIGQAAKFTSSEATFRTWLYRIGRNKVIDHQRRKINQSHMVLDTHDEQLAGNQASAEENLLLHQLFQALDNLPAEQRETFILQQEGFSNREICQITGVGSETVKSRLRYARSATRQRLETGT